MDGMASRERPPPAVSLIVDARALFVVPVDAAAGADTGAVRTAEWTHGQAERNVLASRLDQVEDLILVDYEAFHRVNVIEEPNAADGVESGNRLFVDGYLHCLHIGIEAPSALGLDLCVQHGRHPDALVRPDEPDTAPDFDQVAAERDTVVDLVLPGGAAGLTNKLRNVKVHNDTDLYEIEEATSPEGRIVGITASRCQDFWVCRKALSIVGIEPYLAVRPQQGYAPGLGPCRGVSNGGTQVRESTFALSLSKGACRRLKMAVHRR